MFWNIGRASNKKTDLIDEAILKESPEIFCIAEGTHSKKNCNELVDLFKKRNYQCFYSPLFSENKKLKLEYSNYDRFGLKIFIKEDFTLKDSFSFSSQRLNGRIIVLKTTLNYQPISFIFLHAISKGGSKEFTLDQTGYMSKLRDMVDDNIGLITKNRKNAPDVMGGKERIIILGDFNIQPWENILNHRVFLETSFFKNRIDMNQRKKSPSRMFYNPLVKIIMDASNSNLGGTFYSNNDGWALFDIVLFDPMDGEIDCEIITEFTGGSVLLETATTISKSYLKHGLDHLPIKLELSN